MVDVFTYTNGERKMDTKTADAEKAAETGKRGCADADGALAHWKRVGDCANERLAALFSESGISFEMAVGKKSLETDEDAKRALAFVIGHSESPDETSCAVMSVCEWLQANRETSLAESCLPPVPSEV